MSVPSSPTPTPALRPPPGTTSNFVNPESLSKWTILCVTLCLSITCVVFVLRNYVRILIKRTWILEDYMCCISWSGFVIFCSLLITLMRKHGGFHEWDLTVTQARTVSYWFHVGTVTYSLTIMCTKLTILLLYRRVFLPQRWSAFDIAIRLLMLIICLFYTITAALKLWQCTPRTRIWDKSVEGTCINMSKLLNTSGLFNSITDVLILLVPVKSVWMLKMHVRRKVGCVLLFTVGSIAPIFSIIGSVVRVRISGNADTSYNQTEIHLFAAAELSTGVVCVCLPTLAALGHQRRRRPSASILNGLSNPRSPRKSGPNQPTSLDEIGLFNLDDLEMRENGSCRSDLGSRYAVITAIRGGASTPRAAIEDARSGCGHKVMEMVSSSGSEGEAKNESAIATDGGIMKSFRIEQSYV